MSMAAGGSVLIIDQDSELSSILAAYLSTICMKTQFTTRVQSAVRKLEIQKFAHVFIDPELRSEDAMLVMTAVSQASSLNFKTPLTFMSCDGTYQIPMTVVKRVHSILMKPFTLDQFAYHLSTAKPIKSS